MNKQSKEPKQQRPTTQMNLLLRIIAGGYFIYLAWSMRKNFPAPVYIGAAAVFALAGAALLVVSLKRLFQGDFDYLDSEGNVIIPDDLPEDGDDADSPEATNEQDT